MLKIKYELIPGTGNFDENTEYRRQPDGHRASIANNKLSIETLKEQIKTAKGSEKKRLQISLSAIKDENKKLEELNKKNKKAQK